MVSYTRKDPNTPLVRTAAITSVDPQNQGAYGTVNSLGQVFIDTSYYVGATSVTPSVGDQWHIQNINGQWRLHSRIAFNDPNQAAVVPTQGQHIVGSGQGPIELQGTQVNLAGPLSVAAYTNTGLPDASAYPPGTHVFDTTLNKPVWSNGIHWVDSAGNITLARISASLSGNGVVIGAGDSAQFSRVTFTSGYGQLGNASPPTVKLTATLAGRGALSETLRYPFFRFPTLSGHGALKTSGGQLTKPALAGHGLTSASRTILFPRTTSSVAHGSLGGTAVGVPVLLGTGAGFKTNGTTTTASVTDSIPVGSAFGVLFVSIGTGYGSLGTVTASMGGVSMSPINTLNFAANVGPTWGYIAAFYLPSPPSGSQTISITTSPACYINFFTTYVANTSTIDGWTTASAGSGSTLSVGVADSPSVSTNLYLSAHSSLPNNAITTISGYNYNTLYSGSGQAYTCEPLLVGYVRGNGSVLTPSATDGINTPWGAVSVRLNGIT